MYYRFTNSTWNTERGAKTPTVTLDKAVNEFSFYE